MSSLASDIVISGISCRYPGLRNADEFSDFVLSPRTLTERTIEKDRLDILEFCMHAHQAENCDPQIRILLQCAREALCDAGLKGIQQRADSTIKHKAVQDTANDTLPNTAQDTARNTAQNMKLTIGCVVSSEVSDYGESVGYDISALSGYGVLGGCRAMISNRISFECNLTGASYTLASGNSLVALHNAGNLIRDGICDAVVVGTVDLSIKPSYTRNVNLVDSSICRTEGGGVIVLSRRDVANKVYGSLEDTWSRFVGGHVKEGISALWKDITLHMESESQVSGVMSSEGASEEMVVVFGDNGWDREVGKIEEDLFSKSAFNKYKYKLHSTVQKLGDLGPASGFTSLLIAVYSRLKTSSFVSACGVAGSYCVVQYTPCLHLPTPRYLALSGSNNKTVYNALSRFRVSSKSRNLHTYLNHCFDGPVRGVYDTAQDSIQIDSVSQRPLWLTVGGVGANWDGMGDCLMNIPHYSASVRTTRMLMSEDTSSTVYKLFMSLLVFQIAHIDLLTEMGVTFEGIIGHSFGEIAALYAAGAISREQAVKCAEHRVKCVELTSEGAMLAVLLSSSQPDPRVWVREFVGDVDIACVNSSRCVVISGERGEVAAAMEVLEQNGAKCRYVQSYNKAFHSRFMAAAAASYRLSLQDVFRETIIPPDNFYSSSQIKDGFSVDAEYFVLSMAGQVRFYDAYMKNIPETAMVLELSPHSMFSRSLEEDLPGVLCLPLSSRHDKQLADRNLLDICQRDTSQSHWRQTHQTDSCESVSFPTDVHHTVSNQADLQLIKTIKKVHLTNHELDLAQIPSSKLGDEINAGSLIAWDTSQSWYVPQKEHFPIVGEKQTTTAGMQCCSVDVSHYELNEEISGCSVVFEVLQELVRKVLGGKQGIVVRGSGPVNCLKRSSNNFIDAYVMGDGVDVIYNSTAIFSGTIRMVGVNKTMNCACEQEEIEKELRNIKYCKDITYFVNMSICGRGPLNASKHFIWEEEHNKSKTQEGGLKHKEMQEPAGSDNALVKKTKNLLGISQITQWDKKLQEYGLDSLMSAELVEILETATGRSFRNNDILSLTFKDLKEASES